MEWSDTGIVLGTKKHGETSVVLEVMTQMHGRHLGLVRSGRSRRMQPVLQVGNSIDVVWRARLETHLGTYSVEPRISRAAKIMESGNALYALQTLASHLRLLPEREQNSGLYEAAFVTLDLLGDVEIAGTLLVRFEMALLEALGFGLDLSACAATGANDMLVYISPKTGRAVSASAGEPWKDKLLPLPGFMLPQQAGQAPGQLGEVVNGLSATGFFLDRNIYGPRNMTAPEARSKLQEKLSALAS